MAIFQGQSSTKHEFSTNGYLSILAHIKRRFNEKAESIFFVICKHLFEASMRALWDADFMSTARANAAWRLLSACDASDIVGHRES
jgi:hypothetical protein